MHGIILEGIPAVGKSRTLAALRASDSFRQRASTLILGEHYTERAVEHRPDPDGVRHERLMYRVLAALEPLRVLSVDGPLFKVQDGKAALRFVLERFHLTNILTHARGDEAMMQRVENTLALYHPTIVLLTVDDTVIDARLKGTLEWRNQGWRDYLESRASDWNGIVAYYRKLQDDYRKLMATSILPYQELDISDGDWERAAEALNAILDRPSA